MYSFEKIFLISYVEIEWMIEVKEFEFSSATRGSKSGDSSIMFAEYINVLL